MRTLTAEDLLALWERGAGRHVIDLSLQILMRALPEADPQELERLPLGSRDALLLGVRRATLGDRLAASDVCPACGTAIELELSCTALAAGGGTPRPEWSVEKSGYRLTLRPLDSLDAAAAAASTDDATAHSTLLARSIVSAERHGEVVTSGDLPADVTIAAAESIATEDPCAEITLDMWCPACRYAWKNVLDVASFVCSEFVAAAQRLMIDVHALARAYAWTEAQILALSDQRRAAYLGLCRA